MEEVQKKVKTDSIHDYTDQSNPFNDKELTKSFHWSESNLKISQKEQQRELDQIRKRREERNKEKERFQQQKMKESEDRDQNNYDDWLKKEQDFHDAQNKIRSRLRIDQQRYLPVDYFTEAIMVYKGEKQLPNDVQYIKNPELIVKKLSNSQLLICLQEAEISLANEGKFFMLDEEKYKSLWKFFVDMIKDKLEGYQTNEDDQEIELMLKDKNMRELDELEGQINSSYASQDFKMDMGYFERVLRKIRFIRAKSSLMQFYINFDSKQDKKIIINQSNQEGEQPELEIQEQVEKTEQNIDIDCNDGNLSPILHNFSEELLSQCITQEETITNLQECRLKAFQEQMGDIYEKIKVKLIQNHKIDPNTQTIDEKIIRKHCEKINFDPMSNFQITNPVQDDEQQFDDQIDLVQKYAWMDKYKPRKPQYYNRVKLGYEWNKYNQAHYDLDNPPPKVVQGYKFNVFYPDLIVKDQTPTYTLVPCDNDNFCMVKFSAGAPYGIIFMLEDIAFKVVKSEWEFNDRHGYKCVFQNGILHLYVNFKKYRYKR